VTTSRLFALVFGAIYVAVGLFGFLRPLTDAPHGGLLVTNTALLLGIFAVNWFHNLAHVLIGASGLVASPRTDTARVWAATIGSAYAILFVVGLFTTDFLGILPLNDADNVLHLASALLALAMGLTPLGLRLVGQRRLATA
jgi:hypothetical protein